MPSGADDLSINTLARLSRLAHSISRQSQCVACDGAQSLLSMSSTDSRVCCDAPFVHEVIVKFLVLKNITKSYVVLTETGRDTYQAIGLIQWVKCSLIHSGNTFGLSKQ